MSEPAAHDRDSDDPTRVTESTDEADLEWLRRRVSGLSNRVLELDRRVRSASQELRWLCARAKALERELGRW